MSLLRSLSLCVLLACALTAAGCGGGGGGSTPADDSLVDGEFWLWLLASADEGLVDEATGLWGDLVSDGTGGLTGSYDQNEAGVVQTGLTLPASSYSVSGDRSTVLTLGSLSFDGWANQDGDVVVGGCVTTTAPPSAAALIKAGSGFSSASLSGDYHFTRFTVDGSGDVVTSYGTASFNGAGSVTVQRTVNTEGVISTPVGVAASYVVQPNGLFSFTLPGGETYIGAIATGGELALAAGSTVNGDEPRAYAFLREATSASSSTFQGSYQIVGIERDGGGFTSLTGQASSNGSGQITVNLTRNTDGVLSVSGPDILDYAVTSDGTLTVDPVTDMLTGGVSASGRYAILGGPISAGSNPKFFVLMRR
ncbi:MAG: hypothetical protein QNJ90_13680 [Planctomycetota bacterium]|nr:hypothetical protein [Planctomycetota bacterium]